MLSLIRSLILEVKTNRKEAIRAAVRRARNEEVMALIKGRELLVYLLGELLFKQNDPTAVVFRRDEEASAFEVALHWDLQPAPDLAFCRYKSKQIWLSVYNSHLHIYRSHSSGSMSYDSMLINGHGLEHPADFERLVRGAMAAAELCGDKRQGMKNAELWNRLIDRIS